MGSKFIKRAACLIVMMIFLATTLFASVQVFAKSEKYYQKLGVQPTTAKIRDTWQQIKNAAVIQLVAQKTKWCVEQDKIPNKISESKVKQGKVFNDSLAGDNISTGPWLSNLLGSGIDGTSTCGEGEGLFDMFAYILQYKGGASQVNLESMSVTENHRMELACGKNGKPGILQPFDDKTKSCYASNYYKKNRTILQNLGQLYEDMRINSGNEHILSWDKIDKYDTMMGYHLYSLDYKTYCAGNSVDMKIFWVGDDGLVKEEGKATPKNSAMSFGGRGNMTCRDILLRMNELVKPYVAQVNLAVFEDCKAGIDQKIEEKRAEINEKYINNPEADEEDKAVAQEVLAEYADIQGSGKYVARFENGKEIIIAAYSSTGGSASAFELPAVPTDYIWTCRSEAPFIKTEIISEGDLGEAMEGEFSDEALDACMKSLELGWLICPVINSLSGAVDGLTTLVDGFFE